MYTQKTSDYFIKFHTCKDEEIWIRASMIKSVVRENESDLSLISTSGSDLVYKVKESVNDILKLISGEGICVN